ncbi:MAG: META domain-containing protein, partial [Chloroflexota bacterium]
VTAQFSADGDLTGFDGCNHYFTPYQVDGDTIEISDAIGATKKACLSDDLTVQVQEYYAALGAATTWSVSGGGDLQLRDDAGSLQVDYAPLDS